MFICVPQYFCKMTGAVKMNTQAVFDILKVYKKHIFFFLKNEIIAATPEAMADAKIKLNPHKIGLNVFANPGEIRVNNFATPVKNAKVNK